jgi:phage-related tail fiber protein
MSTTQYLAFGTAAGANAISAAEYASLASTLVAFGFQPGLARSEHINAVLRQATVGVAGLARFCVDNGSADQLDDGSVANFAANIRLAVQALATSGGSPSGAIIAFGAATPPAGWLECNGGAILRASYPTLFAAIGTTWGAGDGSTTFNLPDLRGEFLRGWDHGRGVDSGRAMASTQAQDTLSHNHLNGVAEDIGHDFVFVYGSTNSGMPGSASGNVNDISGSADVQGYTSYTGGAETRPVNMAVMYCIKT